MTVLITLTIAGADSGPFNLYSDIDGFTSAFETGVSKASLLAGYSSALVPDYTTILRVMSIGDCTNYVDLPLALMPVVALPVTFLTDEDVDVTVQLLGTSLLPDPNFIILSLPDPLQGDIYDPITTLKIETTPYTLTSSGSTVLFKPTLQYYGNVDSFNFKLNQNSIDSNIATVSGIILAISDAPIFDQPAPLYSGAPGGTYTYTGTVSDPDNPSDILIVSVASTSFLPIGWTLVQTPGTNTFTLTGPVPAGADYSIILQVDDLDLPPNVTQQLVSVNAVFATLSSMEFKLNYFSNPITVGGVGQSPKTTSAIALSSQPTGFDYGHTCNRAQFNLVVGVYANVGGGEWQWTDLGKGSINNNETTNQTYNIFDSAVTILALHPYIQNGVTNILTSPYCPTLPCDYINIAAGLETDLYNVPVNVYSNGNSLTYYNSTSATIVAGNDRASYFDISLSEANDLATASNWIGSPNRGIVKFKLIPNSYNSTGLANYHSNSSWLQVFKQNTAGTNQEEVLVAGQSFLLDASVVITVDILTNTVTVGTT
jgi:hypothetical protein